MNVALFEPKEVFLRRNLVSWAALCFASGTVNAGALQACRRLITHVTGIATRIGADVGQWKLLIEYAIVLNAFLFGALTASFWIVKRVRRGVGPAYAVPLFAVAGLLVVTASLGHAGAFGPFGTTVETAGDFVLLALLAFASGLQNAAIGLATGSLVRTTHMTGPATDMAVHFGNFLWGRPEMRPDALRHVSLRALKLTSFIAGGVVAALTAERLQYFVFLLAVPPITFAALRSLIEPAGQAVAEATPISQATPDV
jgi:uncharacterized membrane protein YoaK (UPF0700 family)